MSPKFVLIFSLALQFAMRAMAAQPVVLATGDWSEPVADNRGFALRGRLLLIEKPRGDGRRHVAVHIELQDASEHVGSGMQIFCDFNKHDFRPEYKRGLQCELRDDQDNVVEPQGFPFGGAVPASQWVLLPSEGSIRLRATPFGISREKAIPICPEMNKLWVIAEDDSREYFLSGTFYVSPPETSEGITPDDQIWRGAIELPPMRISRMPPE